MAREYKNLDFAKAERGPIAHLWKDPNWIAQSKEDGWRLHIHLSNPCSRLYAVTRGGEEIGKNIAYLAPQVDTSKLQYTVLDGELIPVSGAEFHSLAACRAGKVKDVALKLFDVLFLNGIDVRGLPLEKRLELVAAVHKSIYLNHPSVLPIEEARNDTLGFLKQQLLAGQEGVILKDLRSTYGNGWLKVKRSSTVDVIITGFAPGYDVPCGAAFVSVLDGLTLRDVGKVGILDSEVRLKMNKDPVSFIGKVIEIKCLKYDPISNKLREPIFCRIREDLSPKDATFDKLNKDLQIIHLI